MFRYPAIFSQQRPGPDAPIFACFTASVGEVRKWTSIDRISHGGTGHQRLKNDSKVKTIARFLELDDRNTIPTAITVALRLPDLANYSFDTCSEISIPEVADGAEAPGVVIDGQHRLFGISAFNEMMKVNVVALVNPTDDEIAFQFLVINNKATKVQTDHIKFMRLKLSEGELNERLKSARMNFSRQASLVGVVDGSVDSPFFKSIIWPTEVTSGEARNELVLPAAIEQAIAVIAQRGLPDLADDDALLEFFFTLWSRVKHHWPSLWHAGSPLLSKVGVVTLTTFVIDDLIPLIAEYLN